MKRGGYSERYVCSGTRKDLKDTDVGPYANKLSINATEETCVVVVKMII